MKTLKLRIKDKHSKVLEQLASEVNFVWNYVNDLSFKLLKRTGHFFSAFDMAKYTKVLQSSVDCTAKPLMRLEKNLLPEEYSLKKQS